MKLWDSKAPTKDTDIIKVQMTSSDTIYSQNFFIANFPNNSMKKKNNNKRNYIFSNKIDIAISITSIILILISFNLEVRLRNIIWISLFFIYGILNTYKYHNYKKRSDFFIGIVFFIFGIIGILNLTYVIRVLWSTIWFALLLFIIIIHMIKKPLRFTTP